MIFQEPMTALNPVMTCGAQIDELLVQHTNLPTAQRRQRVPVRLEILENGKGPELRAGMSA